MFLAHQGEKKSKKSADVRVLLETGGNVKQFIEKEFGAKQHYLEIKKVCLFMFPFDEKKRITVYLVITPNFFQHHLPLILTLPRCPECSVRNSINLRPVLKRLTRNDFLGSGCNNTVEHPPREQNSHKVMGLNLAGCCFFSSCFRSVSLEMSGVLEN